MEDKNWIQGPLDPMAKMIAINGVPLVLIGDLPEGAFVQVVHGDNPMGPAFPGPQIAKGAMLAIIPVEIAEKLRPGIKQMEATRATGLGQPSIVGGMPVAPLPVFNRPDPSFGGGKPN
jgi:hypothetical protein